MTVAVTVNLDEAVLAKLDALAEDTSRSRDRLVHEALEGYLEFEAQQIAKIREGLAQADCGEFVSDEEVARIFAKYKIE